MTARRAQKSSIWTLVWLLLAVISFAFALWQPFRRARPFAVMWGVLGIAGLVVSAGWWLATFDHPPIELKGAAVLSGAAYITGIILRIVDGPADTSVSSESFLLGAGETVVYECAARIYGVTRVRAFGGVGTRLTRRIGIGGGLSVPLAIARVTDNGSLIVTNRRVLLAGHRATQAFTLADILDARAEAGRVVLRPARGALVAAEVQEPAAAAAAVHSAMGRPT